MPLSTGQMLQGRYRIVSLLGQGGMGAVYRAWDTRLSVPVALKEMIPQPGLDSRTLTQLRQQFQQEAKVLARMNHRNLVRVTDFFEEEDSAYLVMDFVEGESLSERIEREGALSEDEVLAWAEQLLDALAYCHAEGIIHRDVKPQNIIIRSNGQAELVDFGLVKLWDPSDPHTQTVMRGMGTPEYAPPEQYGAQAEHTDPRSDVYSVGATLYHALTGQAPPTAGSRMASPDRFILVQRLNPRVSGGIETAILKAMELPLNKRFQSAQEMTAALSGTAPALVRFLAPPKHAPTKVLPGTRPAVPLYKRVPAWVWALGGLALLACVVLGLALGGVGERVLALLQAPTTPTIASTAVSPGPTLTAPPGATLVPVSSLPVLAGTPVPWPVAAISPENADRVTQLARWGKGSAEAIAYSPDGQLLAVASSLGVYLYDAETLAEVLFIETDVWIKSLAFSPDGETLASGTKDRVVQLWRVSDGTLLHTLEGHTSWVTSVAFSPDGALLASGSWDYTVRLWRVSDGALLRELEGHTSGVESLAFSPDGTLLASGSTDDTVRLWRVDDGTLLRALEGHTGDVIGIVFSSDGETLASASGDRTVRLWQVDDGTLLRTLEELATWTSSVAFSPDGEKLASSLWQEILLWQLSDGALLRRLEGRAGVVTSLALSPDSSFLASGYHDAVQLWRLDDGSLLDTIEGYTHDVENLALSTDDELLASAADYNIVQLWQMDDGSQLLTLEEEGGDLEGIAFSPDGNVLASVSEHWMRLWQVDDVSLRILEEQPAWVRSVAFSPDGEMLASGWDDGTVQLWRVSDRTLLRTLEGHTDDVAAVAFSPDGDTLASGAHDDTVRLWRISDGTLLHTLEGHTSWVTSIAFSPDGTLLASGSWDNTVQLWQVSDGALLHTLEGHTSDVESVAFSPDGTLLASASDDHTMRLWRVSDGALLRILEGHVSDVKSVLFSRDGTVLISGSDDGTIRLWGVAED